MLMMEGYHFMLKKYLTNILLSYQNAMDTFKNVKA